MIKSILQHQVIRQLSCIPQEVKSYGPSVHMPKFVHTSVSMDEVERVALVLTLASAFGLWCTFC